MGNMNPKVSLTKLNALILQEASCLPQMHMLSLKMENQLHKNCPTNCRDMLQWLPENVVYQILDYLQPGMNLFTDQ